MADAATVADKAATRVCKLVVRRNKTKRCRYGSVAVGRVRGMADVTAERLATEQTRLPIGRTIADAYRAIGRHFRVYAIHLLLLFGIVVVAAVLFWNAFDLFIHLWGAPESPLREHAVRNSAAALFIIVWFLPGAAILSIGCLRTMLLARIAAARDVVRFGQEERRACCIWFLWHLPLWFWFVIVMAGLEPYLMTRGLEQFNAAPFIYDQFPLLPFYIVTIVSTGIFGVSWSLLMTTPCLLALPLAAMGETSKTLQRAGRLGRGNRLRILACLAAAQVPLIAVFLLVISVSLRFPYEPVTIGLSLIAITLQLATVIVTSVIAGTAYVRLAGPPLDPVYRVFDE
jgi:hypothetical protein